ncbi:DNA-binding protein [Flavobacterium rakeshii]|uniref:DNA-binding protein n=1 Tax=Flavobacterium rakeshii TaxID=1038845 RepID=A0A6N8HF35_9FLAO|nr:DNA-binding protein [Flavobacterium rakeshii]MUV04326.1 DNA-binding protein [Flavobacterium rakeshii]
MSEYVTKDDLRQYSLMIIDEIRKLKPEIKKDDEVEWLKSHAAKKMLTMSAGSLQNLRVTGQVRFKKVLGSYYYNRADLQKLFTGN